MSNALIVKNSIKINATPAKIWKVLTESAFTKEYMFGCEIISDWKIGGPFNWKGVFDGKELIAVKGNLVGMEKEKFLAYTTFDPNVGMEDIPENYTTVTYSLTADKDQTLFTVTQGDFAHIADGEKRWKEVYNNGEGWNPILAQIKLKAES
jgi:uncharacterized protein YndB with AHSA1/START domain